MNCTAILLRQVELLEYEIDWLVHILPVQMLEGDSEESARWWRDKAREAARKAMEEQCKNK